MRTILLPLLLTPYFAFAGEDHFITGDEWRSMVTGKTVEYSINGELFVREYYWPNDDVVTMEVSGEQCFEARWDYDPSTNIFCFHNGPTACFWHIRNTDGLFVRQADIGLHFGATQEISAISDIRLSCTSAPIS